MINNHGIILKLISNNRHNYYHNIKWFKISFFNRINTYIQNANLKQYINLNHVQNKSMNHWHVATLQELEVKRKDYKNFVEIAKKDINDSYLFL